MRTWPGGRGAGVRSRVQPRRGLGVAHKVRRTRALGERGMLEADTLNGDLFFYENAEVGSPGRPPSSFAASARATSPAMRSGVRSRCASSWRPSSIPTGDAGGRHGEPREGVEIVADRRDRDRERRSGDTSPRQASADARRRRRARQDRPADRRSDRPRTVMTWSAATSTRGSLTRSTRARRRFRASPACRRRSSELSAAGRLRATTDTIAAVAEGRTSSSPFRRSWWTLRRGPDFTRSWTR